MLRKQTELFTPIVPPEKRHRLFEEARTSANDEPGRMMANEVFRSFEDADGNFVEQFQTTGFDARTFELYLFAYLDGCGFKVDRAHKRPDFIVENQHGRAALEVTTRNGQRSFDVDQFFEDIGSLSPEAVRERVAHEIPIQFGGPLLDKLRKKYWTLPHVEGLPLVLAIESFHDTTSLLFTSGALSDYLYGLRHHATRSADGSLTVSASPIEQHVLGEKKVPSGFFNQPDTENISAVIFSNSGTWGKFTRMGFQSGYHRGNLLLFREGTCHDRDPRASTPLTFGYWVGDDSHVESWGEGLEVFHNPRALVPLPRRYFPEAADHVLQNGVIASLMPEFHPFMSTTMNMAVEGFEYTRQVAGVTVDSILKREFDDLFVRRQSMPPIWKEREWLADRSRSMLATVVEDVADRDWSYAVISPRDGMVDMDSGMPDRDTARREAVRALSKHCAPTA